MSKVQIWLIEVDGKPKEEEVVYYHRLPVNPEKIIVNDSSGDKSLNTYSISSIFPKEYNPSYCDSIPQYSPSAFINRVNKWQKMTQDHNDQYKALQDELTTEEYAKFKDIVDQKVSRGRGIRLVVTGEDIIARVAVVDFSYELNGFDVEYTITLKDTHLQSDYQRLVKSNNAVSNLPLKEVSEKTLSYTPRTEKESIYSLVSVLSDKLEKKVMDFVINLNPEMIRYKQARKLVIDEYKDNEFNLGNETDVMQEVQLKNLQGFLRLYPKYGNFNKLIRGKSNKEIYDYLGISDSDKKSSMLNSGIKDVYHTPFSVIYNTNYENIKVNIPTLDQAKELATGEKNESE